jgi:hypothetical protein
MALMNRRIAFLVFALSAVLAERAAAQNPTLVTLDTTDLELVERSAKKTAVEFTIPARLSAAEVKLRRWSISQDGRIIDRNGSTIAIRTSADGMAELFASFDLSKMNASGRYQATLEFVAPKQASTRADPAASGPSTGQPLTAPEHAELAQTVQLKLNKPAAELRISTPLRLDRTVYFPAVWPFGRPWKLEPDTITLAEASGKSWVKINPLVWDVVLRHGDDPPQDHLLQVMLPDSIDGWGQAQAKMELNGPVSLGTTSGTLTIRAPQLAAQTVDFAVTLVSRVTALWLLPVIVIGIALGWYFRNWLDARRSRLAAIVPAEQELATLDDLINATADRTSHDRLEQARSTLAGKIEEKGGTPETIATATATAATEREAVVKAMNDLRDKLRTTLQAWSRPATVREPLPDEAAPILEELRGLVTGLTRSLDDGLLNEVDRQLMNTLPYVTQRLHTTLSEWLRQFDELKTTPPDDWPQTPLAAKLALITAEANKLTGELNASEDGEGLWKALISAANLLSHFKQDLLGTVKDRVAAVGELAIETLRKFGAGMTPKADAIAAAAAELPGEAVAGARNAAEEFTNHLNKLRATIAAGLAAAWNDAARPLPGLDRGDFPTALAALENNLQTAERGLGEESAPPPRRTSADFAAELARLPERTTAIAVPKWKIVLEAIAATLSEPVTVRARLIVPLGIDQPDVTLSWFKAGIPAGRSGPGTFERSFTFSEPGPVAVSVVAVDAMDVSDSATLIVQVYAVHGARTVASVQQTLSNVELIQNIGAGAIITLAGWLIFSPSFTGSFPEFFAAFLWGFSADIGIAKVRELTESLKDLKVPISIPKQA